MQCGLTVVLPSSPVFVGGIPGRALPRRGPRRLRSSPAGCSTAAQTPCLVIIHPVVDVCVVGLGAAGGTIAAGLVAEGRSVVGLEAGAAVDPARSDGADEVAHVVDQRLLWKRSEEHTSELQSLMRISYAVFCLKKKKQKPDK